MVCTKSVSVLNSRPPVLCTVLNSGQPWLCTKCVNSGQPWLCTKCVKFWTAVVM